VGQCNRSWDNLRDLPGIPQQGDDQASKRCQRYPPPTAGPQTCASIAKQKIVRGSSDPHKNDSHQSAAHTDERRKHEKLLIPALFKWDHL
jgi:hypothetical protein